MLRRGRIVASAAVVVGGFDGSRTVHVVVVAKLDVSSLNSNPEIDQEDAQDENDSTCYSSCNEKMLIKCTAWKIYVKSILRILEVQKLQFLQF